MTHKNTFYKNIFLTLATTAALLLSSCNNFLSPAEHAAPSSDDGKYFVISATLESSLQTSRSAVPSGTNILNELSYAADFHASTGTIIHDYRAGTYDASTNKIKFKFSPPTEDLSNYVLDIYGFPNGTVITQDIDVNKAILKGSAINITVLKDAGPLPLSTIKMKPYEDSSTLGTVNLSVSVPSGYDLAFSVIDKSSNDATGDFSVVKKTGTEFSFTHNATKNPNGIEKGTYTVTFTLKKDNVPFYAWTEKIIVYAGMVTDHWNTGEVNIGGSRVIPASQISTSFYVRGGGVGWYSTNTNISSASASNENSGSMTQPLATVQEAINRIKSINDGSTNYTIYVDGTVQNNATGTVADFSEFARGKISIVGLGTSQAVLKGNKAEISPTSKNSVVIISSGVELTLENLLITDGETSGNGGGINNAGKLTMTGCTVNGNSASYGGGIYVVSGASLTLTDCVIGNENATSVSNVNSWETGNGNCAGNSGGGIYIDTGTTSSPIALAATVTINSSFVSQNYCTNSGGGIGESTDKKYKNLTINNSTIKYNYAGSNGGGVVVYSQDNNSSISSTEIFGNEANSNGGGIYIASSSFLKLTNCTNISNNAKGTSSSGSGIYLNGTLKCDGDIKIEPNNDVYISSGKISLENEFAPATNSVATITPATYPSGSDEVTVLSGNSSLIAAFCKKFNVTPNGSTNWEIDITGKLVKLVPKYSTVYLDSTATSDGDGSETSPANTLANALSHLDTGATNPTIILMSPYSVGSSDSLDFSTAGYRPTFKRYSGFKTVISDYMFSFFGEKTISNVIIDGNYKNENGNVVYKSSSIVSALLYISSANVTISNNTTLQNNYGKDYGSAIYLSTPSASVIIDGTAISFDKNTNYVIYSSGSVTVKNCSFTNTEKTDSLDGTIYNQNTLKLSGEISIDTIKLSTGKEIEIEEGFKALNPIKVIPSSLTTGATILTGDVTDAICEKFTLSDSNYIIKLDGGTPPKGVIAKASTSTGDIQVEIAGANYKATVPVSKNVGELIEVTVTKNDISVTPDYCKIEVYTLEDYTTPIITVEDTKVAIPADYYNLLGIKKYRIRVIVKVDSMTVIDGYTDLTVNSS